MSENRKKAEQRKKEAGLSMVEILVAIGIVGILAAIALVGIAKAKGKRDIAVCRNNLKQWSYALEMYTHDADQSYPDGSTGAFASNNWMVGLSPYYNQTDEETMEICPTAKIRRPGGLVYGGGKYSHGIGVRNAVNASYGINYWVYDTPDRMRTVQGGLPAEFQWRSDQQTRGVPPQDIPVLADGMWRGGRPHHTDTPAPVHDGWSGVNQPGMRSFAIDRHGGSIILIYMDGHQEKLYPKALWWQKWHRGFNTNSSPTIWPAWVAH